MELVALTCAAGHADFRCVTMFCTCGVPVSVPAATRPSRYCARPLQLLDLMYVSAVLTMAAAAGPYWLTSVNNSARTCQVVMFEGSFFGVSTIFTKDVPDVASHE